MRANITAAALAIALVSAAGSACAMNGRSGGEVSCEVIDAGKLAPEAGGAEAICGAIRQATAEEGLGEGLAVRVRVLSPTMLAAVVTMGGRTLPEQTLASADRALGKSAFERFARSLLRLARSGPA